MILIVEDEPSLANVVSDYLVHNGFETHIISDGNDVIEWVKIRKPELILLDLMLPNRNGLSIYRELRTFSDIPTIMATAKVEEIDRLLGLELGADDYVCKPYSPRELVVRVRNVLRRYNSVNTPKSEEETSPIIIEQGQMKVWVDGESITLTSVEFKLLSYFHQHEGQVFSREQLMNKIYNDERIVTDRTIDTHIKNLRKKIFAVNSAYDWIKAVYGVGYRFEME
ncbi:response regulator [Vibrio sp. STUT-A11]|uniref:response regulator n=1 Tax=Vibrio sp. STUT-A11 TaxID=2976236 RepID=UPI0022304634|nr:response regulator [Vibrio sp. STUT-A11]BDR16211.1 DNA-binding response regulator [Vibrio sp. STUT-A11]